MIFFAMKHFSVVVPLIPAHDKDFKELISYLVLHEDWIKEVVVCRSESRVRLKRVLESKFSRWANLSGLTVPLIFSLVSEQAYDGTNRNRGFDLATGDFIAFLDADDKYASGMFETLYKAFQFSGADALLHSYSLDESKIEANAKEVSSSLEILTLPREIESTNMEIPIRSRTNLSQPLIHHAHLSARRDALQERYLDIFPGADTEFCKRIILQGYKVVFINQRISYWNRKRSFRYKLTRLYRKLTYKIRPGL